MSVFTDIYYDNVIFICYKSLSNHVPRRIYTEEDEEKKGEAPKGRPAITEERKRDADDRSKTEHHAHIDENMEQENTQHTIAIDSAKLEGLSLRKVNQPQNQCQEQQQHRG